MLKIIPNVKFKNRFGADDRYMAEENNIRCDKYERRMTSFYYRIIGKFDALLRPANHL
jgi:hypothetical protein